MKQLYLILFIFVFTGHGAQTLTLSANEPVIGDINKTYNIDTSAYTSGLPVGITGPNCNWDFRKLVGAFPITIDSFIAPASAPGSVAFPSASYSQHRGTLNTFFKTSTSPQQNELLGAYSPSLSLTFSNTAVIANYPVTYGYNLSDPVSGTFKYNTSTTGACNGSITVTADGVGTLVLANNVSIPNVLRLKSVQILTLTINIIPFGTFHQTVYNYYRPGQKFPVLNINYSKYQLITGTPTITAEAYGSSNYFTIAGINETGYDKESLRVFPNPFNDHLHLNTEAGTEENEYFFVDVNGTLVLRTTSLDNARFENMCPGIYFLEIKNEHGVFRQKIIKH